MREFLFTLKIKGRILESFVIEGTDPKDALAKAPHVYGGAGGEWEIKDLGEKP